MPETPDNRTPQELFAEQALLKGSARQSFSQGKISQDDAGDFAMAFGLDRKHNSVVIRFPYPTEWVGLAPANCRDVAAKLIELAKQLETP